MREIKFRAWDSRLNKYLNRVTDIRLNIGNGEVHGMMSTGNVPEWTLEQFIGLHDKNGKEIYEGDIVKFEDVSGYKDGCASVIWHDDSCGYYLENDDDNIYDTLYDFTPSYQMTVIGNIHENPELLEERE